MSSPWLRLHDASGREQWVRVEAIVCVSANEDRDLDEWWYRSRLGIHGDREMYVRETVAEVAALLGVEEPEPEADRWEKCRGCRHARQVHEGGMGACGCFWRYEDDGRCNCPAFVEPEPEGEPRYWWKAICSACTATVNSATEEEALDLARRHGKVHPGCTSVVREPAAREGA